MLVSKQFLIVDNPALSCYSDLYLHSLKNTGEKESSIDFCVVRFQTVHADSVGRSLPGNVCAFRAMLFLIIKNTLQSRFSTKKGIFASAKEKIAVRKSKNNKIITESYEKDIDRWGRRPDRIGADHLSEEHLRGCQRRGIRYAGK